MTPIPAVPNYSHSSQPVPTASLAQAKPMIRMVSKLLKAKLPKIKGLRKKGFTTGDIHIKHKKVKYW